MAERIMRGSVRVGKVIYTPDMADQLNKVISVEQITYLKSKGLLFGAGWTGNTPVQQEGDTPWEKGEEVAPPEDKETSLPTGLFMRNELISAGYDTVERINAASDRDLMQIDRIGAATVKKIREALK